MFKKLKAGVQVGTMLHVNSQYVICFLQYKGMPHDQKGIPYGHMIWSCDYVVCLYNIIHTICYSI